MKAFGLCGKDPRVDAVRTLTASSGPAYKGSAFQTPVSMNFRMQDFYKRDLKETGKNLREASF
jgi:hypothetical protein